MTAVHWIIVSRLTPARTTRFFLGLQTEGKILIAGGFTSYNGVSCRGIARLIGDFVPGSLFTSIAPTTNGYYYLTLTSLSGRRYILEASANLFDWFAISTNVASSTNVDFIDSGAPSFNRCFYRSR